MKFRDYILGFLVGVSLIFFISWDALEDISEVSKIPEVSKSNKPSKSRYEITYAHTTDPTLDYPYIIVVYLGDSSNRLEYHYSTVANRDAALDEIRKNIQITSKFFGY